MKPIQGKFLLAAAATVALSACGGSSSSDDSPPLVVNDFSVTLDTAQDIEPIDVLAHASGDNLTLVAVSAADYGTTSIENTQVTYQPDDGFTGIDSFTYTVSDGDEQAEGQVEVEVVTTVTVAGRVVDSPIANATVTITFAGNRYEVDANDEGYYELPVALRALEDNEVVRVTARGAEDNEQGHVSLSSILVSSEELIERANADGEVTRDQLHDVTVTHVTTARDVLIRRAARDEVLTAANVAEFGNTIDPQLMLQMAGVIKLIIDDEDFALPEGFDNIEGFLEDADSYNEFVEDASQGGENSPLNRAIDDTLQDPDVMPELRVEDLYGRYMEIVRSPSFLMPSARDTWDINEDGLLVWVPNNSPENMPQRHSFTLNGNALEVDGEGQLSELISGVYINESFFDDPDTKAAWLAKFGPGLVWVNNFTTSQWIDSFHVASVSENEIIARYTYSTENSFTFEHEGTDYSPSVKGTYQRDVRLVNLDVFKQSDLIFDLEEQPVWLLDEGWGVFPHKFHANGRYEILGGEAIPDAEYEYNGNWTLSEDKRTLTLQNDGVIAEGINDVIRLTRHRAEGEYQSILTEFVMEGAGETSTLFAGIPLPAEADFSAVEEVIESDLLFNSIVNRSAAGNWDANDRLLVQDFMFNFFADGTGHELNGLCKGERLAPSELCSEPVTAEIVRELDWEYTELDALGKAFRFQRAAGNYRYWVPLNFSSRDILTVLEWENRESGSSINMFVPSRINHYQLTEKPPLHAESASAFGFSMFAEPDDSSSVVTELGYKIMSPQSQPEQGVKH